MISKDTISLVRDRTDIVAVVSESVPSLKKHGRRFVGLCPFHKEKTPSFHVNPDTGLFSMTETWNYTLAPGGQLQNRGQTEDKIFTPEPATLLILGAGIFGLGVARRRKSA